VNNVALYQHLPWDESSFLLCLLRTVLLGFCVSRGDRIASPVQAAGRQGCWLAGFAVAGHRAIHLHGPGAIAAPAGSRPDRIPGFRSASSRTGSCESPQAAEHHHLPVPDQQQADLRHPLLRAAQGQVDHALTRLACGPVRRLSRTSTNCSASLERALACSSWARRPGGGMGLEGSFEGVSRECRARSEAGGPYEVQPDA